MKLYRSRLSGSFVRRGFSLVEVVLATGIMALGVITILGLLPHGLEMTRKTANEQAETRIIDQIVGELQAADWSGLQDQINTPVRRYFDDQGLEISQSGNGGDFNMLLTYVVEVTLPDLDVKLPSSNSTGPDQNLRRVIIKMISAPLMNFNFDSPTSAVPVKAVTQLVANTGLSLANPN